MKEELMKKIFKKICTITTILTLTFTAVSLLVPALQAETYAAANQNKVTVNGVEWTYYVN